MPHPLRLFFAIELNENIRKYLFTIIDKLKLTIDHHSVRWTELNNLHITTRFIGNCQLEQLPILIDHANQALQTCSTFKLALDQLEFFPNPRHPHVLSLKTQDSSALLACVAKLENAVTAAGFPSEDRIFRPHLSLARITRKFSKELINFSIEPTDFPVDHMVLFNSREERRKRIYEPIETFKLKK